MSIILNKEKLATSELRKNALDILEAGYEAINTEKTLRKKIRVENENLIVQDGTNTRSTIIPLSYSGKGIRGESGRKIIFVGIGKCALDGAKTIEDILSDYLTKGAVIDIRPASEANSLKKCKYFEGTHPLPSEQNIKATKEILEMVKNLTEKDLVVCLISGGGSALFELPMEGISLKDIEEKTKELTAKGADIYELNKARKEMSQIKGGKFAKRCRPALMVSLIFSDVPGDDISVIASGPTVLSEPSEKVKNILIVSNRDALVTMKEKAEKIGFDAKIETKPLSGNAKEMGKRLTEKKYEPNSCVLFGGETTVKISENHGIGGRNQELALSALMNISEGMLLMSAASDGWDNTDHAGAIADRELFEKAKSLGLSPVEFLENSDSYNFFKQTEGAICTGKLGSNVSDLVIILCK